MKTIWIINHYAGDTFFDKGGRHYWFARFLKQDGLNPIVFCCNNKHNPGTEEWFETKKLWIEKKAEEIGVPYVFIKGRRYVGNGKQRILNMIDFYFNLKATACQYSKNHGKPDIIFASSVHPLTLLAGIQIAKKYHIKCICEIRDLWPESLISYGVANKRHPFVLFLRKLEKWIYVHADDIVFTAEGEYDYIIEQGWDTIIPRGKVHYINNGIDLAQFDDNKENYTIVDRDLDNPDIFKVVYAGSIRKVNNVGKLLDTAKLIKDERIRILIWGDGDELPELRKRINNEKINNVTFKGRIDKKYIPYITSKADLNIAHNTPSPLFRFGISFNKLFDYLAAGRPILSDFPCPYNPAVQGEAGIDVQDPTSENIAKAIEQMSRLDKRTYDKYCNNARRTAEKYDFRELTKKLFDIITR